jgi:hypothetical protein
VKLRSPHFRRFARPLLAAACAALWLSCMSDGPSTETGNPNLQGTLRDVQGNPAAGTVKLFRVAVKAPSDTVDNSALVAPVLVRSMAVGADGGFRFDSLPAASYAVEGADGAGKNFGLAPGLRVAAAKDTLQRMLTLKPPARLSGMVTRGPNALPAGVAGNGGIVARIGGVDRFAYSDTAGAFSLENVPEGVYRIAFAAPDGHYEPKFLDSVKVASGATLQLPLVELDWSRFQAPPAVAGLALQTDSTAGTVRLTWRAVKLATPVRYEVSRRDSLDAANDRTWTVTDTACADTLTALPAGRSLVYRVVAINALGNRGPAEPAENMPVTVPVLPDTSAGNSGMLSGVVTSGRLPAAGAQVDLYAAPSTPGSPFTVPKTLHAMQSSVTDANGRYRFEKVPAGRYTVAAKAGELAAIRQGVELNGRGALWDSLEVAAAGSVEGLASRDSLWVSSGAKGDDLIHVNLAGTPYESFTTYASQGTGGPFKLVGVPEGSYTLVVHAGPDSFFLPDTLPGIKVGAGAATTLPTLIKARYNPAAPPPKIDDLNITASSRASVSLAWRPVSKYALLKGYRVLRLDAASRETARSGFLTAPAYSDDVSALASGTLIYYVVIVVSQSGREGLYGGNAGMPVPFTVP